MHEISLKKTGGAISGLALSHLLITPLLVSGSALRKALSSYSTSFLLSSGYTQRSLGFNVAIEGNVSKTF